MASSTAFRIRTVRRHQVGELSALTCPGCGGPLWRISGKAVERYRCRVGHAYSRAGLFQSCWESSERKLYSASQMLEENALLGRRVLESPAKAAIPVAEGLREQVSLLEEEADTIRNLLVKRAQKHQTDIGVGVRK
jgi:two-component system, chemotaxis family, protein-glutamate methylesterase/glutaminase